MVSIVPIFLTKSRGPVKNVVRWA